MQQAGNLLEALAGQRDLAGPVDLGVAGEDLLDQGRARARQPDDEDGPGRLESRAGQPLEKAPRERRDQAVDEAPVLRRLVGTTPARELVQGEGVGLLEAGGGVRQFARVRRGPGPGRTAGWPGSTGARSGWDSGDAWRPGRAAAGLAQQGREPSQRRRVGRVASRACCGSGPRRRPGRPSPRGRRRNCNAPWRSRGRGGSRRCSARGPRRGGRRPGGSTPGRCGRPPGPGRSRASARNTTCTSGCRPSTPATSARYRRNSTDPGSSSTARRNQSSACCEAPCWNATRPMPAAALARLGSSR